MPNSNYTMVVTSCARHDLLKDTLNSFYSCVDLEPRELIIIEDSDLPMPEFLTDFIWKTRNLKWMSNGKRKGQIFSIDRAYREVQTDFIFHCEDDWKFLRNPRMVRAKEILSKYPEIFMVSLRGNSGWHPLVQDPKYPFLIAEPYWRGIWGGIAFNPGMRRTSDYKALGSYGKHVAYGTAGLGHEAALSKSMLDQGFRIADFGEPIVMHTGGGRSKAIDPLPPMQKILIAIPACWKFEYGAWESEQSPLYDAKTAWLGRPYGTDIHISGRNPRIQAVLDTWAKDIEPFKSHVTLKFFYGKQTDHKVQLPPDSVLLDCPDDYEHLIDKTRGICKYAFENGYDWVFKCDDDTYVWVDRLILELMSTIGLDYGGYRSGNVCSGGPGYWLSRYAMNIVAKADKKHQWAEDVNTSLVLANQGVEAVHLEGHQPGFEEHWFNLSKVTPNSVAIHAVQPESMRKLWKKEHGEKTNVA